MRMWCMWYGTAKCVCVCRCICGVCGMDMQCVCVVWEWRYVYCVWMCVCFQSPEGSIGADDSVDILSQVSDIGGLKLLLEMK